MGQSYNLGDETLWDPSNGASRLFLRQVAVFEAELGLPSGIGPMVMDESEIDPDAFEVFVNALLDRHRATHHAVLQALTEGFVLTVLALAERAGTAVRWEGSRAAVGEGARDVQVPRRPSPPTGTDEDVRLREQVAELARSMPR